MPWKAFWPIVAILLGNVIALASPVTALPDGPLPPPLLVLASPKFTVTNFALLRNASLGILVKPAGKVTVSKFGMLLKLPRFSLPELGQLPSWSAVVTPVTFV